MKNVFRVGVPVAVLLLLTLIICAGDADIRLARLVYGENGPWPGIDRFPWDFIYIYAPYPAFIIAALSLAVLVNGLFTSKLNDYRSHALFLILLLALGPGLIINVILKDNYGRARPREIVEFGGSYKFTQVWEKGDTGKNSSFPSGHASVGFYLMAPWFIFRQKKRAMGMTFLLIGLSYGFLVGTARIFQGGHFLSDVLWSGGLVYITGELLCIIMNRKNGFF